MEFKPEPKTWLLESILATLFCCLPLGVLGIIEASKVKALSQAGMLEEAMKASESAKKYIIYSALITVVISVLIIIGAILYHFFIEK